MKKANTTSFLFSFWILHVESSEPSGTTQPLLWVIRLLMRNLEKKPLKASQSLKLAVGADTWPMSHVCKSAV
eukprot:jgi/Chrzof1/5276/Cz15g20120.t1